MKVNSMKQANVDPPVSKYINPNWDLAAKHGLASKIGVVNEDQDNLQFCNCCFHHIIKKPIPLSQNPKQLQFLGFGLPLYFAFVRYCIFLLLFMICTYNLPSLYYALTHNQLFCKINLDKAPHSSTMIIITPLIQQKIHSHLLRAIHQQKQIEEPLKSQQEAAHEIQCTGWMIYLSRIQKKITIEDQLMRFSSFFIHFLILLFIRDRLTKMKYYFDERTTSPSDFAVFIKNMPLQIGQVGALRKILSQSYGDVVPRQIILIPDLKAYFELEKQHEILISKLLQLIKKQKRSNRYIRDIQKEIILNENKQKFLIQQDKQRYFANQLQAERAVIIFNTQDQKWALINAFQTKPLNQNGWENVKMTQASQPLQIIWENSSYNGKDKKYFKALGWFLSMLTLAFITGIFIIISHIKSQLVQQKIIQYQKNLNKDSHLLKQAFILVLGMIFLVVLFNKFILAHLFHKFTEFQRHSSTYKFQFYFCLKYCLGLFFTTALMTLIIQDFMFQNFFRHNFGVIEEQTIMFLFNSIFVPLFWLINPMYLLRNYKRWRNFGSKFLTQKQANNLMEDPPYDVGKRYGQVIQIMWFTFLYMTIIPVGAIFSCIGLVAYYWIDKYNLLRRSSIHGLVSGDLIDLTLKMLQFTLPLRAAGQILFDYQMRDGISVISWVYLLISIIFIVLPSELFINLLNEQRFFNQKLNYEQAQKFFKNTYKDVNILFNRLEEDRTEILQQKIKKKKNQQIAKQTLINQTERKRNQQVKVFIK